MSDKYHGRTFSFWVLAQIETSQILVFSSFCAIVKNIKTIGAPGGKLVINANGNVLTRNIKEACHGRGVRRAFSALV
jgi:hypothetical protein